ncbi:helix-turn-helix domain-containing protein [Hoylesella oralis]|uniref:helix-turn-helix domain-containing protein n=1 Tax=Hoylesella oralis TaxID=28134 RepID=UPI0028E2DB1C|nr:helix-turn-helix domain-containing protein [Hoylesella oralis]
MNQTQNKSGETFTQEEESNSFENVYCSSGDNTITTSDYVLSGGRVAFGRVPANEPYCVRLCLVTYGWCEYVINGQCHRLEADDFILINEGGVKSICQEGEAHFSEIALSETYMKNVFDNSIPPLFKQSGQCFTIHLSEEERNTFNQYKNTLICLEHLASGDYGSATQALFLSLFKFTETLYESKVEALLEYRPRNKRLTESFTRLVAEKAQIEHELAFYADKLCITAHHLSIIVKQETGRTVKNWIDRTLLADIQRELKYSDKSLKEIADEFNFPAISSLCKFFRRMTGTTANAYRNPKSR